jgi:hypothetical protein
MDELKQIIENEGRSGNSPMYEKFMQKHNLSTEQMDYMLETVAYMESKNKNVSQSNGGPGQGYYQIEDSTGSNTFQTTLQQYVNVMGDEPDWVKEAKGTDDPKLLSKTQQEDLFLAGVNQSSYLGGSDKRLRAYSKGYEPALKLIWMNDWWKGSAEDVGARSDRWDADIKFKNSLDNKAFDAMLDSTSTPALDSIKLDLEK